MRISVFFAAIYALRYPVMSLVALVAAMAVSVATWIMMWRTFSHGRAYTAPACDGRFDSDH